jgi:hypothetical protein
MIDDYHTAKEDGDEMTEARLMTKLLKEADPVLQAARNKEPLNKVLEGKEPETPVLKPRNEVE